MNTLQLQTRSPTELLEITQDIQALVSASGVPEGLCVVYVPHTTAGVTINEAADPSVKADLLMELNKIVPFQDRYQHTEGNSAAHIKATLVGSSVTIPIIGGSLALGTWQGIYFCEFDGPRRRQVFVKIVGSGAGHE
ncbi:MAG: secondary thiamine-phosphate synthase enzyme YjbQ [Spirochaetes bacterium]|nr:secondary thiamine-phosphate synthase enzyme YjbQ [Spirochaetota bacterium]